MDSFELLFSGKVNDVIPVYKYKSKCTGMRVVLAQVDGPIINGYLCLGTEAHDDDGLPHTLEHLVFMGSEDYPYKGVLDLLANRCLASGTNAWTETDHTCYTMTTAGSEGFLNLLPIYLDHVLYPTLTESSYVTEVHHINGKGDDAGVVYCEMQARENSGESRVSLALLRAMYPGRCGYKSETGGMLQNLRTSTSHEKVCKYHREFYRPENLSIIITGQVQPEQALNVLKSFEDKIVSKGDRPPFTRPWQDVVPGLQLSIDEVVPYPSDEEDHGLVYVAWRGPLAKEQYKLSAIMMMMEYLTDTAVAPLQRDFVEIEEPYCNMVGYSIVENSESCFYVSFDNVEKEKLPEIRNKLLELLQKIATEAEKLDMKRMHNVVHRRILEAMDHIEDAPHDTIAFHVIGDLLYGDTMQDMDMRLNEIKNFRKLDQEPHTFWLELLKEYCVNKNCCTIIGIPSKKEMEEMGESEKARVAEQAKTLGKDGLKEKTTSLKTATEDNEKEPPERLLTSVDVPNVDCIRFHSIRPSHNHDSAAANNNAEFPLADIPLSFQLDDIQTNFVTMSVVMDTDHLSEELRSYLPLYVEAILESPVLRDGVIIGYEEVISELAADTVYNCASLGIDGGRFSCGDYAQVACLVLKVEVEKYQKGIQWLRELLFQVEFTAERLKIIAQKMISDVARLKRKGSVMVKTLFTNMLYNKHSNKHASSMLRQHKFLKALLKQLEDPHQGKKVLEQMKEVQKVISTPSRMHVHVAAQVSLLVQHINKPHLPWQQNFLPQDTSPQREKVVIKRAHEFLYSNEECPGSGFIVGVGSVESNFLTQCVPCLTDYNHPDVVAIDVYIQYLTQLEGPMWRQIRGLGLSYHYSMYVNLESGMLVFLLHKSTHVVDALVQAKQIVDGFVSGSTPFSDVELEAAKSSLIFEVIEKEKTPADASSESMLNYFRNVNQDYNRRFIQQVPMVTVEDLKRVGSTYIAPLFDVTKSKMAVCCHPTKVKDITVELKKLGRDVKAMEGDSFLSLM